MHIVLSLSVSPVYESILFPQHFVIEFETIKGHIGSSNLDSWLRFFIVLGTSWDTLLLRHYWLAIGDFVLLLLSEHLWLLVARYLWNAKAKIFLEASLK